MRIPSDGKQFWAAFLLLVVLVIFFGVRAQRTVSAVLAGRDATPLEQEARNHRINAELAAISIKDSLLTLAQLGKRDPFRDPPAPKPERRREKPKPVHKTPSPPKPETPPSLQTLLFDRVNPTVQLKSSGGSSGWLHVGDSYNGWEVVEITENNVKIQKDNRTVLLSAL